MTKELVQLLVTAGFEEAVAKAKVKDIKAVAKKLMPDATPEGITSIVNIKIKELASSAKNVGKFNVTCIGAGDIRDMNDYSKKLAREAYEEDPGVAIDDGIVTLKGDKVIPLDTKEFLDKAEKYENKNFGKPLRDDPKRECAFIVDTEDEDENAIKVIVRSYGNVNVAQGEQYLAFGSWKGPGTYLNLRKQPAPIPKGMVATDELWDDLMALGAESDFFVNLSDVPECTKGDFVIVKGIVQHADETSNGGYMIILDDDDIASEGVVCFINSEALVNKIVDENYITKGMEAIALGKFNTYEDDDGEVKCNISAIGLLKSDDVAVDSSVMNELDEVLFS